MSSLDTLLNIASPALGNGEATATLPPELRALLERKDGFVAFESALVVYPAARIAEWNDPSGWKSDYDESARSYTYFGADAFGFAFGLAGDGVVLLDPETGELVDEYSSLESWAEALLRDPASTVGHTLCRQWQEAHGALPPGRRLAPRLPFVLGGKYEVDGLYAAGDDELTSFRADLHRQIRELPDGSTVTLTTQPEGWPPL